MDIKLTDIERDQISEIINIGAGNAATALSTMLGKKVQMDVPSTFVGKIESVIKLLGEANNTVLTVYLKTFGDVNGALAIIFPPVAALKFNEILTGNKKNDLRNFSDADLSSLREVGNILMGASITAFSKFLNMNILHSIPDVAVDMLGAIMDSVIVDIAKVDLDILVVRINLTLVDEGVTGELFYLFDPFSTQKILSKTNELMLKTNSK